MTGAAFCHGVSPRLTDTLFSASIKAALPGFEASCAWDENAVTTSIKTQKNNLWQAFGNIEVKANAANLKNKAI